MNIAKINKSDVDNTLFSADENHLPVDLTDDDQSFLTEYGDLFFAHCGSLDAGTEPIDETLWEFRDYIRKLRTEVGLSRLQLAEKVTLTEAQIAALEYGLIPADEIEEIWLDKLASCFGVDIAEFQERLGTAEPLSRKPKQPDTVKPTNHLSKFPKVLTDQWGVIHEIIVTINQAINVLDFLTISINEIVTRLQADVGAIRLINSASSTLELKSWVSYNENCRLNSHQEEPIAYEVIRSGKSQNYPDFTFESLLSQTHGKPSTGSLLCVPLRSDRRIMGTISLASGEPGFFDDGAEQFVGTLADYLALATERRTLLELGRELSQLTLDEILEKIIESACLLMGTTSCAVILVDRTTKHPIRAVKSPRNKFNPRSDGLSYEVAKTGMPLIIVDAQSDERVKDGTKKRGVQSMLGIPLEIRVGEANLTSTEVIGALFVDSHTRRRFGKRDIELLKSLAGQAAIAIDNAQSHEDTAKERDRFRWMVAQLTALNVATQMMTSVLDFDRLLDLISRLAANLLNAEAGGIMLLDPTRQFLTFRGAFGRSQYVVENTKTLVGEGLAGRVVRRGKAIIAHDIPNNRHYFNPTAQDDDILAVISTPLWIDSQIVGTINVQSKRNRWAFNEDDLHILSLMATHAAIAIKNARAFSQASLQNQRLHALIHTTIEVLHTPPAPRKLVKFILEQAISVLKASGGGFYTYDEAYHQLTLVGAFGELEQHLGLSFKVGNSVTGHVVQTNSPIFIDDYLNWPYRIQAYDPYKFRAVAGAPVSCFGKVWGVISIHDQIEGRIFNEDDLRLLSHFGNLAAVALENAEKVTTCDESRSRLEKLAKTIADMLKQAKNLPLEKRIQVVEQFALEVIDAERCEISVFTQAEADSADPAYEDIIIEALSPYPEASLRPTSYNLICEDNPYRIPWADEAYYYIVQNQSMNRRPTARYDRLNLPLKRWDNDPQHPVGVITVTGHRDLSIAEKGFSQEDECMLKLFMDAAVRIIT